MKHLNLNLVNEINDNKNLDYTVILTNISVAKGNRIRTLQKLEFINKYNENVRRNPVVGTPLMIQYYLLGMKKYQQCLIPF